MISIVIPTYKEIDCLDLCIKSALDGQVNRNEIIVVIDGTERENSAVIEKYSGIPGVVFLILEQNFGMCVAQNEGVKRASSNCVLLVNDDHVFQRGWDIAAFASYGPMLLTSFPIVSHEAAWHRHMVQLNFGRVPANFNADGFNSFKYFEQLNDDDRWFASFPIMINKYRYIALGGFDEHCLGGVFADNDLFIKAKIMGMRFKICIDTVFYHFGSIASNRKGWDKRILNHNIARRYMIGKWGRDVKNEDFHYMFSKDDVIEFNSFNE